MFWLQCSAIRGKGEIEGATQGTGFQPSLRTLRVSAASPQAAPPQRLRSTLDPTSFEDLLALVKPDYLNLNAIAGNQRRFSALPAACVNRLCCCRWTRLSQPSPTVDSAVIPPISCPAQAPPGRLWLAGLRPASRRLSRSSLAPKRTSSNL